MVPGRRGGSEVWPEYPYKPRQQTCSGSDTLVLRSGQWTSHGLLAEAIAFDQIDGFLTRLKALPIEPAQQATTEVLELPAVAQKHNLTNYDAAYLALALRFRLPLATTDNDLRRAATAAGVEIAVG
jgi:predicted nucleic acid-binding protein